MEAVERKQLEVVAKHLRFNVPTKAAVIKREKVEYFTGASAVDCLMKSKWAKKDDDSTPHFQCRADAITLCNNLVELKYMVRVNKIEVKVQLEPSNKSSDDGDEAGKAGSKQGKSKAKGDESSGTKKKKKRFKLETHVKQIFRDGEDLYIWKYDPPSRSTYVIGFIVVLGAVAWTLQPLWPASTRVAMWYVAIVAAGLIGVLLALLIFRWFLYGLVLVVTMGKIHFWVFPNLNEEQYGFVDSFKPIYSIERNSGDTE